MSINNQNQSSMSRRERERARQRRKKVWLTEPPLDLRSFYRDALGVKGDDVLELLVKNTRCVYRNKGEVYAHAGEPVSVVRFVITGVSRGYVLGDEGEDNVLSFGYRYGEPVIGASCLSGKTDLFLEAVTDMELLEIPTTVVKQGILMEFSNALVYEKLLADARKKQMKIQIALNTLDGEDRYRWFLEEYKDIAGIVPQNFVASFLGIQPQSLSRIKRQMKAKVATV